MAIRDRVTVKTKDGVTTVIQATKAGGRVEFVQKPRDNVTVVEEFGQAKDPLRVLTVANDQVIWLLHETDVPPEASAPKPKRNRKVAES